MFFRRVLLDILTISNAAKTQQNLIHVCSLNQAARPSFKRKFNNKNNYNKQQNNDNTIFIQNLNSGGKLRKFRTVLPDLKEEGDKFVYKRGSQRLIDSLEEDDEKKLFNMDEDLGLYTKNENFFHQKVIDEDVKRRKKIKMGIIKKKIAKIEGEKYRNTGLLTWDAKEQIKYLNLNEPEVWTPERIADSFPITVESCKKLLRSPWAPKTLDQLIEHDQKVMDNWKAVANMENIESGN